MEGVIHIEVPLKNEEKDSSADILVMCDCGVEPLEINLKEWKLNIVGLIQFKCHNCGKIHNSQGLWEQ